MLAIIVYTSVQSVIVDWLLLTFAGNDGVLLLNDDLPAAGLHL